jgi:hypothetical protein
MIEGIEENCRMKPKLSRAPIGLNYLSDFLKSAQQNALHNQLQQSNRAASISSELSAVDVLIQASVRQGQNSDEREGGLTNEERDLLQTSVLGKR